MIVLVDVLTVFCYVMTVLAYQMAALAHNIGILSFVFVKNRRNLLEKKEVFVQCILQDLNELFENNLVDL